MNTTWLQRACVTAGTITTVGLLAAGTASAHVTAHSPDAVQGGYTVITFQVPTESATATTTGLKVTFPTQAAGDKSLSSVRTAPLPGWTATIAKNPATAAPESVTWTAQPGTSISGTQFGQFQLSVGPLPKTGTLAFPADQTYSDGSVVHWDQQPNADGSEPEHPVPTVKLAAAGTASAPTSAASAGPAASADASPAVSSTGTDTTARWLGGIGLLLGALGLGAGVGAALRHRRRA